MIAAALITGEIISRVIHLKTGLVIFGELFILYCLLSGRRKYRINFKIILYIVMFMSIFDLGYIRYEKYNDKIHCFENNIEDGERVRVYGKITKIEVKTSGIYYYIDKAYVIGKNCEERKINIILYAKETKESAVTGQKIDVYAKYDVFNNARNKGGFNEKDYYYELGISGRFIKEEDSDINIYGENDIVSLSLYKLKKRCINILDRICTLKYSGLYKGILLGEKNDIDSSTKELYKLAGISHLLAISGLHISIIGNFIYKLLRKVMGLYPAGITAFVMVLCYGNMIGESISAKRAIIMFAVSLSARIIGRTYDVLSSLSVAFIIIIYTNPLSVCNSGMLLSFGAIFAIVVLHTPLVRFLKIKNKIINSFLASEMINLITRPLCAYFYYEISIYSSIINIMVLPLMGVVVGSGVLGIITGMINTGIGSLVIKSGCVVLKFYEYISKIILKIPFSVKIIGIPGLGKLIAYFSFLIIIVSILYVYMKKSNNDDEIDIFRIRIVKRICVCGVVIILNIILFIKTDNSVHISMLDVGQGDSICINDNKNVILVDAGSSNEKNITKYTILPFLKASGIEKVDYLVMTHADMDHINGMEELMNYEYNGNSYVKNIIVPKINESIIDDNYRNIIKKAKEKKINVIYFKQGDMLKSNKIKLECIWPTDDVLIDKNDLSITFYLIVNDFKMLFTGDLGKTGENQLIEANMISKADILKTGHHGSNNSTTEEFIEIVSPKLSIISCGLNNSYGHPGTDTLMRLKKIQSDIRITKDSGEIDIIIGDKMFEVETFLQ